MFHNATSIEPQNIYHRGGQRIGSLLPEVNVASVVGEAGVEDGEVGGCDKSRQATDARLVPPGERVGVMLDDASVEMIAKGAGDVSVDVELVYEFAKDGGLLLGCRSSGWAIACCGCKGEDEQEAADLHNDGYENDRKQIGGTSFYLRELTSSESLLSF